jgi:hypothetical protein
MAITATKKECLIALRLAAKCAASCIARRITFGFDDATT